MAIVRNIKQLAKYIGNIQSNVVRAHVKTMLAVTLDAEGKAKRNVTQNFPGRNNRKLTGRLLNSVFSGFDPFRPGQSLPKFYIGTRGIPYGRIHEEGGTIKPTKAKNLWVKLHGGAADKYRRMTPTKFFEAKEKAEANEKARIRFAIITSKKGNKIAAAIEGKKKKITPLFVLKNQVKIPARPYLEPAVDEALKAYPVVMRAQLKRQLAKVRP